MPGGSDSRENLDPVGWVEGERTAGWRRGLIRRVKRDFHLTDRQIGGLYDQGVVDYRARPGGTRRRIDTSDPENVLRLVRSAPLLQADKSYSEIRQILRPDMASSPAGKRLGARTALQQSMVGR